MKDKKISIPKGNYISGIEVNDADVKISFKPKRKVALLFICLNAHYWPYIVQVIKDAKVNFLPHHNVDFFVWTDIPEKGPELQKIIDSSPSQAELEDLFKKATSEEEIAVLRLLLSKETVAGCVEYMRSEKGITLLPTDPVPWPTPTLMRYHLFLNEEVKLKEYDHIFYLDADMRIVQKISDDIFSEGLTTAPHPGYAVNSRIIPPLEPNRASGAFIERLGRLVDEGGKQRFIPFYAAGGFQGGNSKEFIKAMKTMKQSIDKDFNNNYTAIWNDESHWNRYLWDYQKKSGQINFLDVSYIYPDSLIKEYYEPLWGRSYEPKIITLTKPFNLSKQGGTALNQHLQAQPTQCPTCKDYFTYPGHRITRVVDCPGAGKVHQMDTQKI